MLIIRKSLLYVFSIGAIFFISFIAIDGYYSIYNYNTIHDIPLKYNAEHLLFLALLFTLILFGGLIYFHVKSRNLLKDLENISGIARFNLAYTSRYVGRLGSLGKKINELYAELIKINEMQALKISALVNENDVLIDNIKMSMFVLNIQGSIVKCSKKLLLYLGLDKNSIVDKHLNEIVQGLDVDEVIKNLEKTKDMLEAKDIALRNKNGKKVDVVCYPIFNAKNQLTSVLCVIDERGSIEELSKKAEQIPLKETQKKRSFINFFKK